MSDETTPQDSAAMPPASAGSQPVAWGIMFWAGDLDCEVFQSPGDAERHLYPPHSPLHREDVTAKVVPLYLQPQPTLTDEEREAIRRGIESLDCVEDLSADATAMDAKAVAALRGMLERLD